MLAINIVVIIQRLGRFVLSEADTMSDAQIEATLGLLDLVLPSLVELGSR